MNNGKKDYTTYTDTCIDNIIDALDSIEPGKITLLTGDNATGKSLIRKLLTLSLRTKMNRNDVQVASTSMERRTSLHSELGGCGVFCRDDETMATSDNSLSFVKQIINSVSDRYIVIDEPEIGMSLSLQASFGVYLNKILPELNAKNIGVLIITHSKELCSRLTCIDAFVNVQKKSYDEWFNEEPEIIDIDEFREKASALYMALQKRLK